MGIKAECAWGEGPDVLIVIGGDQGAFPLMDVSEPLRGVPGGMRVRRETALADHLADRQPQYIKEASVGVSAAAARHLAAQLIVAAERAEELERGYEAARRAPG